MNCLSSRSGGAVSYIRHVVEPLASTLSSRGIRLKLLIRVTQIRDVPRSLIAGAVCVPDAQVAGMRRALWEFWNLGRVVRENECSLVFTPYQMATLLPSAINVVMLRNMEPFFSRGYQYSAGSRLRNEVLRIQTSRTLRRADATVAVSEFASSYAKNQIGVEGSLVRTIYHGRDESFSPEARYEDNVQLQKMGVVRPYVFTCGSILPYRRLEDVLHAFQRFSRTDGCESQLVIAGSGTDDRYRRMIHEIIDAGGNESRIRDLGQVDNALMKVLYRHARIFVTATEVEACPNIAIEAMSSGCTIVAADSPALRELLGPGAVFYKPRERSELSRQMAVVWKDNELRARLAALALRRSAGFSWTQCASQTGELIASLLPGVGSLSSERIG